MSPSSRSLLALAGGIVAALALVDVVMARVSPAPPSLLEVDGAVADYRAGDPDTLVLGSSHARSFLPMRELLGHERLAVIPVESGGFGSYEWVLRHRLQPLIDGRGARRLSRVLLITTNNDLCPAQHVMLPARAWTAGDFFDDLVHNGITGYNRNYLQRRVHVLLSGSRLVQERGSGGLLVEEIKRRLRTPQQREADTRANLYGLQRNIEDRFVGCDDPQEKDALARMLEFFRARGLDVTVVSFPLLPSAVSERARATTLRHYVEVLGAAQARAPFRLVDLTELPAIGDGDFMADHDHLSPDGNRKLTDWLLAHDFAFLKMPLPARGPAR